MSCQMGNNKLNNSNLVKRMKWGIKFEVSAREIMTKTKQDFLMHLRDAAYLTGL